MPIIKINRSLFSPGRLALVLTILWSFSPTAALADEKLHVIGYGVKSCAEYLTAFEGWDEGVESGILEYIRYREWLAGLVTGLTLATGEEILRGVDVEGAMRRIQVDCDERRESDFFGAGMRLIRLLNAPEGDGTATKPGD